MYKNIVVLRSLKKFSGGEGKGQGGRIGPAPSSVGEGGGVCSVQVFLSASAIVITRSVPNYIGILAGGLFLSAFPIVETSVPNYI